MKYMTLTCSLFLLTVLLTPTASANQNDLDLTISGVSIDSVGGGDYRVKPHVKMNIDEFDTDIEFDVKVDIGGTVQTHALEFTLPPGDTPISRAKCYTSECVNDCPTCCGFTTSCGSCSCSYTNIPERPPVSISSAVTITITVDVNGDVSESDETNNVFTVQFTP